MKALARALINAVAYLDLSDEAQVDPEVALQALEEIALHLSYCTPEEKQALAEVLAEMRSAEVEHQTRPEMVEFLDTFLASLGLDEDDNYDDDESEPPSRFNLM